MKLIIQGQELSHKELQSFADLAESTSINQTGTQVWRFNNVNEKYEARIAAKANNLQVDFALLDDTTSLGGFKLLAMDMDSTFIQIECIDEIADFCGLKPEVAAITEASMRGELDFNESLTKRVALLKGLDVSVLERVYEERLRLSPGAEQMLYGLKLAGIKTLLVSGGFTFFTGKLQDKYGIDFTKANVLEIENGQLTGEIDGDIVNAEAKARMLKSVCEKLQIPLTESIAMGDGANDLLMMGEAGLSIAYHAKPKVKKEASVAINYVGLEGVINIFQ